MLFNDLMYEFAPRRVQFARAHAVKYFPTFHEHAGTTRYERRQPDKRSKEIKYLAMTRRNIVPVTKLVAAEDIVVHVKPLNGKSHPFTVNHRNTTVLQFKGMISGKLSTDYDFRLVAPNDDQMEDDRMLSKYPITHHCVIRMLGRIAGSGKGMVKNNEKLKERKERAQKKIIEEQAEAVHAWAISDEEIAALRRKLSKLMKSKPAETPLLKMLQEMNRTDKLGLINFLANYTSTTNIDQRMMMLAKTYFKELPDVEEKIASLQEVLGVSVLTMKWAYDREFATGSGGDRNSLANTIKLILTPAKPVVVDEDDDPFADEQLERIRARMTGMKV
jgi:hypothetical protein